MPNKKNIVIKVKYPASGRREQETGASSPEMITEWDIKRIAIAAGAIIIIIASLLFFSIDFDHNSSGRAITPSAKENKPAAGQSDVVSTPLSINITEKKPESAIKADDEKNDLSPTKPDSVTVKSDVNLKIPGAEPKQQDIPIKNEVTKPLAVMGEKENDKKVIQGPVNNKIIRSVLSYDIINKEPVRIISSPVRVGKNRAKQIYYFTELKNMDKQTIYHEWRKDGRIVYRRRINIGGKRWRTSSSKFFGYKALGSWKVRTVDKKGHILDEKEFEISLIH
ncbi:MAG: DUF2914 domain-containing protein [Gammaproteobacteria bacterium]